MTPAEREQVTAGVIPAGERGGFIALAPCPGIRIRENRVHFDAETLATDLDMIRSLDAAALVTLMEDEELRRFGLAAEQIGGPVRALGAEWHHLPVPDFGAPGEAFEAAWRMSGPRLRGIVREGGRIVLHCLGGRGRSGTVAARLLVELGADPDDAIRAVRAARPGAIEVAAQEAHIHACRAMPPDFPEADGA